MTFGWLTTGAKKLYRARQSRPPLAAGDVYGSGISALPKQQARPPPPIAQRLARELHKLQEVAGFVAAAIARRDGLPIHHTFPSSREAASLCATAAAVVGASVATGKELDEGGFSHGIVQYRNSTLVLAEAGPEAIVACMFEPASNLGFALIAIRNVARTVGEIMAEV